MPSSTAALAAETASSTASLRFLSVGLGGRADLDDGDAAGQLGQPLLELLAIPVGVGGLDLGAQLLDAAGDGFRVAAAVDDDGARPC